MILLANTQTREGKFPPRRKLERRSVRSMFFIIFPQFLFHRIN